ncbi:helix-turn-helix domain-containing protein, partial [Ralstonia pseudosolanacearum]
PRLLLRIPDTEVAARVLAGVADPLRRYPWAGNVRELQSVVERIAVELADTDAMDAGAITQDVLRVIAPEVFEARGQGKIAALSLRERSRGVEAEAIRAALAAHGGDRDAVCKALRISKTTLWRRLNAE